MYLTVPRVRIPPSPPFFTLAHAEDGRREAVGSRSLAGSRPVDARSAAPFQGRLSGIERLTGACDSRVEQRTLEPSAEIRGRQAVDYEFGQALTGAAITDPIRCAGLGLYVLLLSPVPSHAPSELPAKPCRVVTSVKPWTTMLP